uniref:Dynein light chain n=1 Tax=Meloidogyne hapla TaxID=6305 RepID=A0A1I8B7I1_MELHA
MDFEQQEKQFLDEVDDMNTFDVVLRKAQEKGFVILNGAYLLSDEFFSKYYRRSILR